LFLFSLQLLPVTFLILRRTDRDMIKIDIHLRVKYPLLSSDFYESRISHRIAESTQISNFMKIHPVEVELFFADSRTSGRSDRWTDITMLIVALRNFVNAP
jgi:hypothetical protein